MCVAKPQGGADVADSTVFKFHLCINGVLGGFGIQGFNQHAVAFGNKIAPNFAGAGQLTIIGIQLFVQNQETLDLGMAQAGVGGEVGIDLFHALPNQLVYGGLASQIGVAGVRNIALFSPVTHGR